MGHHLPFEALPSSKSASAIDIPTVRRRRFRGVLSRQVDIFTSWCRESFSLLPYQYRPLDQKKKEIRLFKLSPGDRGDPLRGKLYTVSLDDDPTFDAVSYLWGETESSFPIHIGKYHQIGVHRNLIRTLIDLRSPDNTTVLWADAICIDQTNDLEKSHQVPLMHQVYTNAKVVRAWIDVEVDANAEAFQVLPRLRNDVDIEDYSAEFWFPVAEIFRNEYWDRLWVQQELVLAQDIVIHCRQNVFHGEPVTKFQGVIMSGSISPTVNPVANQLLQYLDYKEFFLNGISRARQDLSPHKNRDRTDQSVVSMSDLNMLDIFIQSRHLRCTEPHDHVYGLLGIMTDAAIDDWLVDYQLPLTEVYTQVIDAFLGKYQSLHFLCYDPVEDCPSDMPSWLPSPEKHPILVYSDIEVSSASGRIDGSKARVCCQGLALTIQGLLVDRVDIISQRKPLGEVPILTWMRTLEQMCLQPGLVEQGHLSWLGDNVLSLIFPPWEDWRYVDLVGRSRPELEEQRSVMIDLLQHCEMEEGSALTLYDIYSGNKSLPERVIFEEKKAVTVMYEALWNMMFIGLESKRIGLVHVSDIQPGDEVWVLFGCPMPVILRPRPEKQAGYTWISYARIPGLMNGEACEGILDSGEPGPDYKGPPVQEITLW